MESNRNSAKINYFTARYNVTGSERKRLADCIAEFLGCEKKYLGVPSCAYQAGYIEISKDGAITFDDRADSEEIETLLEELEAHGFHAEPVGASAEEKPSSEESLHEVKSAIQGSPAAESAPAPDDAEASEQSENAAENAPNPDAAKDVPIGFTVSIPLEKVKVGNLTALLNAKGALIRKALGVADTPIEITGEAVSFPWFNTLPDADTARAYTAFISALCRASRERKRITAKVRAVENEKYAFRCFLLSLGFIGNEHKTARRILLKNLSGNSAFRSGKQSPQ